MRAGVAALALACTVGLAATSGAPAAGPAPAYAPRQSATFEFTKQRPGASTGTRLEIDYVNPDDSAAKPPAVRRVVLRLARGARFDTGAPASCSATDAELMASGEAACPPESRVGDGQTTVDSGVPGPSRFVEAKIDFFNNTDELVYINTVSDTEARTVIRAQVTRRKVITDVAMLPGTPPDGGAIDTVSTFDPPLSRIVDGERRSYVTTPPRCPARGTWHNRVFFTYSDGVTARVLTESPCRRGR